MLCFLSLHYYLYFTFYNGIQRLLDWIEGIIWLHPTSVTYKKMTAFDISMHTLLLDWILLNQSTVQWCSTRLGFVQQLQFLIVWTCIPKHQILRVLNFSGQGKSPFFAWVFCLNFSNKIPRVIMPISKSKFTTFHNISFNAQGIDEWLIATSWIISPSLDSRHNLRCCF